MSFNFDRGGQRLDADPQYGEFDSIDDLTRWVCRVAEDPEDASDVLAKVAAGRIEKATAANLGMFLRWKAIDRARRAKKQRTLLRELAPLTTSSGDSRSAVARDYQIVLTEFVDGYIVPRLDHECDAIAIRLLLLEGASWVRVSSEVRTQTGAQITDTGWRNRIRRLPVMTSLYRSLSAGLLFDDIE